MTPNEIYEESTLLLSKAEEEMSKNDWPEGMHVSYNNEPFSQVNAAEKSDGGGLSSGGIAGIIILVIALIAAISLAIIIFIRQKRDKFEEEEYPSRAISFGTSSGDPRNNLASQQSINIYESDFEESSEKSSDSGSSSSGSDDDSENGSYPDAKTAISGGDHTYLTNVAQARPEDIEDDASYSSGDDDEDYDDDEGSSSGSSSDDGSAESGSSSSDMEEDEIDQDDENLRRLQQSGASDEPPAVFEDRNDSGGQYNSSFSDQEVTTTTNNGAGGQEYDSGRQYPYQQYTNNNQPSQHSHQQHTNPSRHSDPSRQSGSGGDDGDTMSVLSADPPGQSYRDLPQPDDYLGSHQQQSMHQQNNNMGHYESNNIRDEGVDDSYHSTHSNPGQSIPIHQQQQFNNMGYHESNNMRDEQMDGSYHSTHSNSGHPIPIQQQNSNMGYYQSNNIGDKELDGSYHSTHSNPGSHHSYQSHSSGYEGASARSHHSQGSRHSNSGYAGTDSAQSHHSHGSRHSSSHSHHSKDSHHSRHSNHSDHSQGSHHSRHSSDSQEEDDSTQPQQQQQQHDQYPHGQFVDRDNNFSNQQASTDSRQEYMDTYMDGRYGSNTNTIQGQGQQQIPSATSFGGSNGQYHQQNMMNGGGNNYGTSQMNDHYAGEGNNYQPPFNSNIPNSNHHRPEELDEVSTAGSAYTAKTHQMSNTSYHDDQVGTSSAATMSTSRNQEEEGEESITNIFKSLSEIQTRLASKGTKQPPG